jgi:hypothetical protein
MSGLLETLAHAESLLVGAGLRFALVGGAAIVARARPRFTRDLDLLVELQPSELPRLLGLARAQGFVLDAGDRELAEEGLIRLRRADGGPPLDLIRADSPYLVQVITRATPVGGIPGVPVASLEDLVLLKLDAHRPIDIDDVLAIKDVYANVLDRAYLESEARRLGLADRVALYFADESAA